MSFAASVAADTRGVHMSRFVESLHVWRNRIGVSTLSASARGTPRATRRAVGGRADSTSRCSSNAPGRSAAEVHSSPYDCSLEGRLGAGGARCTLTTRVPITSLCPCSREISDYGAHNQRGSVEITSSFDLTARRRPRRLQRPGRGRRERRFGADLLPAQAIGRALHHDARLREPSVRRGHHPRRRGSP